MYNNIQYKLSETLKLLYKRSTHCREQNKRTPQKKPFNYSHKPTQKHTRTPHAESKPCQLSVGMQVPGQPSCRSVSRVYVRTPCCADMFKCFSIEQPDTHSLHKRSVSVLMTDTSPHHAGGPILSLQWLFTEFRHVWVDSVTHLFLSLCWNVESGIGHQETAT